MRGMSYKDKSIVMGVLCAVLVVAIALTVILLINSLSDNNSLDNKEEKENKLYATVSEVGDNFVKVKDLDDGEEILINTSESLNEGDFIVVTYNEDEELSITPNNIELIASSKEVSIVPSNGEVTTTPKSVYVSTTEKTTTSKKTTTSTKTITTTKKGGTTTSVVSDDDILEYAKLSYEEANGENGASITNSIKTKFVTLIDFIFYNGTIKGRSFSELKESAKAKVIYYTLLIDSKIDSKWPDYKETIRAKTTNLKERLIALYMDITTSVCENHADGCEMIKSDFVLLKKSLNLTWEIIKSAFSYGYNKTYTYLKNWYEVWREQ